MGILPPPVGWFRGFAEFLSLSQRPITSWLFCFARKGLMGGGPPFSRPLPSLVVIMRPAFGKSQAWRAAVGKGGRSLGGNLLLLPGREGERAVMSHTQSLFLLLLLRRRRRVDNVVCVLRPASEAYFLPLFLYALACTFFPWREWHGIFHKIL